MLPNISVSALKRNDGRAQKRSLSAPLGIIVPSPSDVERLDGRTRLSPGPAHPKSTRRQPSATDSLRGLASYSLADEPANDPQESSAGEDLYPGRSVSPRQSSPDPRKGSRATSPERRRSGARRHTVTSPGPGRRVDSGLIGLGLGDERAPVSPLPRETSFQDSTEGRHPASPSARFASSARAIPSSPTPIAHFYTQHSPALAADRRPSIASVQSGLSNSTTPTRTPHLAKDSSAAALPQILRSPPSTVSAFPANLHSPTSPTAPCLSSHRQSAEFARAPPPIRTLPQVIILERLERTRPSVQQGLLDILRERRLSLGLGRSAARRPPPNLDDTSSMRTRRTEGTVGTTVEGWEGSYNLPEGCLCIAIVCEKESEAEDGAWGGVSRHLIDRFSLSHTISADSFLREEYFAAPPPPSTHPLSRAKPHLSSRALSFHSLPDNISPSLQAYVSDLISTLRHHPLLEGRMVTARATLDLVLFAKLWVVLSRSSGAPKWESDMVMLPRDIISILMGVIGHRLKLRDVVDEKSTFWGSEVGALEHNKLRERGVEGVIRTVVSEV